MDQKDEEEASVNLFTDPHNRMKELVSWPLTEAAKVSDVHDLEPCLQAIYEAMWELKTHEYIENHFIMDRLKQRLHSRQVYNELVCNCHEDSKLLRVIALVEKVYEADTQRERVKYGRRLQKEIKSFLSEFLHHMAEEEAVFQPLLLENFDSKELKDMKDTVEKQHTFFREKVKTEKSLKALKRKRPQDDNSSDLGFTMEDLRFKKSYCQEVNEQKEAKARKLSGEDTACCSTIVSKADGEAAAKKSKLTEKDGQLRCGIDDLPEEVIVHIFSHLGPKSLLACGAVNRRWRAIVYTAVFWRALYPTQWARGQWSFDRQEANDDDLVCFADLPSASSSLASSVESLLSDDCNELSENLNGVSDAIKELAAIKEEDERIYAGIGLFLLPKVGSSVSTLLLSASQSLTDEMAKLFLRQVPNVRCVNLSYTLITSEAFNELSTYGALTKLEELNLSGCSRIGDNLFLYLSRCYAHNKKRPATRSKLKRLILSGCRSLTSACLPFLSVHSLSLKDLDLSGCYKVDGETLSLFVQQCPRLKPEKLAYCNDIEDGPYQDSANGCNNLECETRFCCQRLRN